MIACQEKANYLLKFSAVSRVPVKKAGPGDTTPRTRPKWASKGKNWNKISTVVSTVGKFKQQVREGGRGGREGGWVWGGGCRVGREGWVGGWVWGGRDRVGREGGWVE